ncbi:hypothetical protein LTR01_002374 [Friedmanniomyces endolithicus]|nr:hypothetical protein LTS09_010943 [Friedmanniomyces endolithicus]KAK0312712.1 hypothetical protein LTR01_002374 [Friedmanniomyces endolithicus]KAK0827427.1 hypothetical protein LTR73_005666 [Friedmanniomyces endolithicus]
MLTFLFSEYSNHVIDAGSFLHDGALVVVVDGVAEGQSLLASKATRTGTPDQTPPAGEETTATGGYIFDAATGVIRKQLPSMPMLHPAHVEEWCIVSGVTAQETSGGTAQKIGGSLDQPGLEAVSVEREEYVGWERDEHF